MNMTSTEALEIAYHEAGHAVAVLALGLGERLADDVDGDAAVLGKDDSYTQWYKPCYEDIRDVFTDDETLLIFNAALVAMAGKAVEEMRSHDPATIEMRYEDDLVDLQRYIDWLYPDLLPQERWKEINAKMPKVKALLRIHWSATAAIAQALHNERCLSKSRLEQLFSAHSASETGLKSCADGNAISLDEP